MADEIEERHSAKQGDEWSFFVESGENLLKSKESCSAENEKQICLEEKIQFISESEIEIIDNEEVVNQASQRQPSSSSKSHEQTNKPSYKSSSNDCLLIVSSEEKDSSG